MAENLFTDNPDLDAAREVWAIGSYSQARTLGNGERYTVSQTVQLDPAVKGRYIVVRTDGQSWGYRSDVKGNVGESDEANNVRGAASIVTARSSDLQVTAITTQPDNFSGEDATITWTVTNRGDAVWPGTKSWNDAIYISSDPQFIPQRATLLGVVGHSNVEGLAAGASYTTSSRMQLPAGTAGQY